MFDQRGAERAERPTLWGWQFTGPVGVGWVPRVSPRRSPAGAADWSALACPAAARMLGPMEPDDTERQPEPLHGPSVPVVELDLFGGLTEEELAAAQDELRRGCGWG